MVAARKVLKRVDVMVIEIHSGICNGQLVREILAQEFEYVYELSAPSTEYPVVMACRTMLENVDS